MQVVFNVLPIHHTYGLHIAAFHCFFEPVTVLFLSKWDADTFLDSIPKLVLPQYVVLLHSPYKTQSLYRYHITSLVLVPSLIYQIVHHPRFLSADFTTVQTIRSGAAYLPTQLRERLWSRFPNVERIGGGMFPVPCYLNKPYISGLGYGMSESVSSAFEVMPMFKN